LLAALEADYFGAPVGVAVVVLTEACKENANLVLDSWWSLAGELVAKYSDGYLNLPDGEYATPPIEPTRNIGYPSWWLDKTNYSEGPTDYKMK
jgi:hypothetical protein